MWPMTAVDLLSDRCRELFRTENLDKNSYPQVSGFEVVNVEREVNNIIMASLDKGWNQTDQCQYGKAARTLR